MKSGFTNKAVIVLMPGLDGTGDLFSDLLKEFPKSQKAIIVRYAASEFLQYTDLFQFVKTFLPTTESYVIVAESFSTPLAIQIASENPKNLIGVVLCAGFARSPITGWPRDVAAFLAPVLFRLPLSERIAELLLLGRRSNPNLKSRLHETLSTVPKDVQVVRLRQILSCDVRAQLRNVRIPVLYMQAEDDALVSYRAVEEIRTAAPTAKIERLKAPHLILQTRPCESFKLIDRFIRKALDTLNS